MCAATSSAVTDPVVFGAPAAESPPRIPPCLWQPVTLKVPDLHNVLLEAEPNILMDLGHINGAVLSLASVSK